MYISHLGALKMAGKSNDGMHYLTLKLNNEFHNIVIPLTELELIENLEGNNEYTVEYVQLLISQNVITLEEPLQNISRIVDGEQIQIFPSEVPAENSIISDQTDICTAGPSTTQTVWTDQQTVFLLEKYELYIKNVGPLKRFKNKKTMWQQISKDMLSLGICRTEIQIENRYKTIMKRKKEAVENNSTSGSSRMDIPFEEEINKITALDDSIEPEVLRSINEVKILKPKNEKKKMKLTHQDPLLLFLKEKEQAKERRHQEKMELLKKFLGETEEK